MYALILNNQIVGVTDYPEGYPSSFQAIPAPEGFDTVTWYYDPATGTVKRIPPKPDEVPGFTWVWSYTQWVQQELPPPPPGDVVQLPNGNVKPEDVLSHPLAIQVLHAAETDQVLLVYVVELIASWMLNRSYSPTVLNKILTHMGIPDAHL